MAEHMVTVYLKAEKNVELKESTVSLSQIASVYCQDKNILARVKSIKVLHFPKDASKSQNHATKANRKVISMLEIISQIQEAYSNVQVENIGESDIIVTLEKEGGMKKSWDFIKTTVVVLITGVGAAFSTMAFHNDISITRLFSQLNVLVTGSAGNGFGILEISYSVGVAVGILVFFNHFGKKRFSVDPTPIEVEMRKYEEEIQLTLMQEASRKDQEVDVD